ncbi:hypothetical protein BJY01DRAFT_251990 [Aspergillus pseudoustus]|uniref:Integral membrane protein n=1 Tax=Aspergillus pseudoustus TaxID=1810923 RepID=A0ABR4JBE0_9EURO
MAPYRRHDSTFGDWRDTTDKETLIVEGWSEGFMFGALMIMSLITVVNMRRGVILHKLILLELLLAMGHGTFCFFAFKGYGWYLSSTAALLYSSLFMHNVVAWLKIRPFFTGRQPSFAAVTCKWVKLIYLLTLAMTIPPLIFQIFNNFRFFNNQSRLYERVRPYEILMRDPWWIFSCLILFIMIRRTYSLSIFTLVVKSRRFAILLLAIFLAIVFTIMDLLSSVIRRLSLTDGVNPYWKLALVFKCLSDNIILDNFRSVLQQLMDLHMQDTGSTARNTTLSSIDEMNQELSVEVEDIRETSLAIGHAQPVQNSRLSTVGRQGVKIHLLPSL